MTITGRIRISLAGLAFLLINGFLPCPPAQAQDAETEPNQPCTQSQPLGAITLPHSVSGSLDSTEANPDVDFFSFIGTPGAFVRVDLRGASSGSGTLPDPLLGAFDSGCNLFAVNDDSGTLDSQLVVAIPADGILVLGVTAYPDGGFVGGGMGTYLLSIAALAPIGSISGRVIDAVSGDPPAFSEVRLLRCTDAGDCSDVAFLIAGPDGGFRFSSDFAGQPLEAGTYVIIASAPQYQSTQTNPFLVRQGEDRELGNVALQPYPVQFMDPVPCANIPAAGGTCRYSVRVANRLRSKLQGAAWSIVQASGIGSLLNYTVVQTDKPKKLTLQAQESKIVQFEFQVPAKVSAGAFICADVFFGDDRQQPLFNTLGQTLVFCITKDEGTSFSVVPQAQAQKLMRGNRLPKAVRSKGKVR